MPVDDWVVIPPQLMAEQAIWENPPIQKYKKEPLMKKESENIEDIRITDLHKYPSLNKYEGLSGKIPARAGTTYVGVEIELEKVKLGNTPNSFVITEDGSLKDNGREFVTVPIQFKYLEVELERLFGGLAGYKCTPRCSIHIHINARDFTLSELKSFLALYMVFERSLYRFSGDRWINNFCVPLKFAPHIPGDFIRHLDTNKQLYTNWHKYSGLNLCPLYGGESTKIGTVEFRHMVATDNIEWIINWINLIVSLKITAKKIPWIEIQKHLETMNTTSAYYWLAEETFKRFSKLITDQPTFQFDVESCITTAKTVFLKTKPSEEEVTI